MLLKLKITYLILGYHVSTMGPCTPNMCELSSSHCVLGFHPPTQNLDDLWTLPCYRVAQLTFLTSENIVGAGGGNGRRHQMGISISF